MNFAAEIVRKNAVQLNCLKIVQVKITKKNGEESIVQK